MTIARATPQSFCRPSTARRGGFSVMELMVSASLLVVIMLGLLAMFYQTEKAFRIGMAQTDILEGGRATVELIANDLRDMRAASDILHWPHVGHVDITNFAILPGYEGVFQPLSSLPNDIRENWFQPFYFMKRENDQWRGVRYDFDPPETAGGAGTLYRMELIPGTVPPDLINDPEAISARLSSGTYFDTFGTNYGRIVDGVVHLALRAYDRQGNLDTNYVGLVGNSVPFFVYGFTNNLLPAFIEVELGILEPKSIERYRGYSNTVNYVLLQTNFVAQQAKRVHLFRQRVPVRSVPVDTPMF